MDIDNETGEIIFPNQYLRGHFDDFIGVVTTDADFCEGTPSVYVAKVLLCVVIVSTTYRASSSYFFKHPWSRDKKISTT